MPAWCWEPAGINGPIHSRNDYPEKTKSPEDTISQGFLMLLMHGG